MKEAEDKENLSILKKQSAANNTKVIVDDYFKSPEAFILFAPKTNENVTECLVRRIEMLGEGTSDDNVLNMLCAQDEVNNISNKGMTHLRMQFMYLRKAYEVALQYMNGNAWK